MTYHATYVLQRPDGAVLVEWRTWAKDWVLPGGEVEPNEKPIAAAIREAEEELGITVTGPVRNIDIPETHTYAGHLIKAYLIEGWDGEIPDVDFDNQAPLGWLTPEEMLDHDVKSNRLVARAIVAQRNAELAYEVTD